MYRGWPPNYIRSRKSCLQLTRRRYHNETIARLKRVKPGVARNRSHPTTTNQFAFFRSSCDGSKIHQNTPKYTNERASGEHPQKVAWRPLPTPSAVPPVPTTRTEIRVLTSPPAQLLRKAVAEVNMAELRLHDAARSVHQHGPSVRERRDPTGATAAPSPYGVSEHHALLVPPPASRVPAHVHAFLARQENSLHFLVPGDRAAFGSTADLVSCCCRGHNFVAADIWGCFITAGGHLRLLGFRGRFVGGAGAGGCCAVVDGAKDRPVDRVEVDAELYAKLQAETGRQIAWARAGEQLSRLSETFVVQKEGHAKRVGTANRATRVIEPPEE